jgi:hypothetical protein
VTTDSVVERLYGFEQNRLEKIEKTRNERHSMADETEIENCFFQPQIYKAEDQVMRTT